MKLKKFKITDVREVIGELIAEAWSPHDAKRLWKFPTVEERIRIEREFGMRLRWDAIMGSQKYDNFTEKWKTPRYGRIQSLLYYAVGVSAKDVHSTLDDDFGIVFVALAYDSPFGKPSEYWVAGYGPKHEMLELEQVILTQMLQGSKRELTGGDRLEDWLKHDLFHDFTSEMIYKCVWKQAHAMKMNFDAEGKSGQFHISFFDPEEMQYAVRKAEPEIKVWIHKEYPHIKVQIKADRSFTGMEFNVRIYNKYTNQMLGIMNYVNVSINAPRESPRQKHD